MKKKFNPKHHEDLIKLIGLHNTENLYKDFVLVMPDIKEARELFAAFAAGALNIMLPDSEFKKGYKPNEK